MLHIEMLVHQAYWLILDSGSPHDRRDPARIGCPNYINVKLCKFFCCEDIVSEAREMD